MADAASRTKRTIYLDCTRTFLTNVHTGIERMVSGLVHAGPTLGADFDADCQPILFKTSTGFETLDSQVVTQRFRPRDPQAVGKITWRHRLRRELDRTRLIEFARGTRNALDVVAETALSPVRRFLPSKIPFGKGDIIVLLDVNVRSRYWGDLQRAREAGAEVCLCVHDLIPLSHPSTVDRGVISDFSRWWRDASQTVDYFICNSQSTWREVQSHLPAERGQSANPVQGRWFRLGVGLDKMRDGGAPREEIRLAFEKQHGRPTYVQVGMMSPRKNHTLALDALDHLWLDPAAPALVIVGKYGWRCEEVANRIRQHREFGKRLFWFESVNDDELDFCYRQSTAMLTTSFAEGFNLPIVESLSRGTPVIATDIPTHREVGGRFAAYFPASDAVALSRILMHPEIAFRQQSLVPPESFTWPDWNESCREFLHNVLEMSEIQHWRSEPASGATPLRRAA